MWIESLFYWSNTSQMHLEVTLVNIRLTAGSGLTDGFVNPIPLAVSFYE